MGFISFNNRNIVLRHKANRSEEAWNYSRATTLDYLSLNAGTYNFDIEFSPDYFTWSRIQFPHTFKIHPAWWESYYFKIVILLLIIFASYYFFRVRYNKKLLRLEMQSKVRSERERIAKDLHDSLGGQLSSISIGVNRLAYENNDGSLQPIQELADNALIELRNSLWVMDNESISFAELEQRIIGLFWQYRKIEVPIDLQVNVDQNLLTAPLPSGKMGHLYKIIQEAAHNCIKHSRAAHFNVRFEKFHQHIQVTIIDDGIGFSNHRPHDGEQYGMKNMRQRAERMNAKLTVESELGSGVKIIVLIADDNKN